ncbi:hypothetical protein Fcan01_10755 [Folsomia candida]|uniref:C2H2-type domain-containing protein n=1 Tax=Folsomia candida TaxID=158441 RepID=A0A226EAV5_FOLCA|nr:hypothetical protein Fcan01_10755 [Folsomia candida]
MVYKCSRCSRHFNSEQALSTHKTGFHKVTLFNSDDAETNQDDSADTSESNETSSDDEPQAKKERRSRGGRRNKLSNCSREGDSRDSSSDASSDEEEEEDDTESQASGTSGECCKVCRTLHKPDRVDFWGEPLSEYHIHGVELMLSNEDSMNVLTKLMQFLELPQTQEEKMLTFGEHVKNVIASIMQAAKNGEMVVTRKLLTDIVRSSEGLPNDNPYA